MRLNERNQIIEILDTIQEMFTHIRAVKKQEQIGLYGQQCRETLQALSDYIENADEAFSSPTFEKLQAQCDKISQGERAELKKEIKKANRMVETVKQEVRTQIAVEWKAVFLPYKASMWTAMESIWKAAEEDPSCEAVVMPIPYQEMDPRGVPDTLCYEGELFPGYVPIVDYREYSVEEERPELIVIHNPYDDQNTVTRVPERFFSSRLKEYTRCLVYTPYFTYSYYTKGVMDKWFLLPAVFQADQVVVQSRRVKNAFVRDYGFAESKFVAEGSPKIDAVAEAVRNPAPMPEEWQIKLEGKQKIFLLNTHMMYFIESANYASEHPQAGDYGIRYHREILRAFTEHSEYGLIWRPHPLIRSVMNERYAGGGRYKDGLLLLEEMENTIRDSTNCVIDQNGDYRSALCWSDALITTRSSLTQEYMVTGKPVLMLMPPPDEAEDQRAFVRFRCNYFSEGEEGIAVSSFLEMIREGKDPKKEERLRAIHDAFANFNGTAGERVYWELCRFIDK